MFTSTFMANYTVSTPDFLFSQKNNLNQTFGLKINQHYCECVFSFLALALHSNNRQDRDMYDEQSGKTYLLLFG